MPKPVIDYSDYDKKCNSVKEICPVNVFDIEKGRLVVKRPQDCIGCKACEAQCEKCIKVVED
jgi:NAD-dependent dihydropyrimidine dehydrogenase PreA subunit